jgi:lipopolysaccharide/colanic/teichoic acid biosynthesis glycosyltransferase
VLGIVLAVAAIPLIAVLAVGSAVNLRHWPIFVQRRVGKNGKTFPFPKLRTLPRSTSPVADKYALAEVAIPRFCRFLRHTHLDELPQLLLVVPGWMSLVGPRPEMPRVLTRYDAKFAAVRCSVRPGLTGLWQISDCSNRMIFESPQYDLAYLERGGVRLDVWVLYRTARAWLPSGRAVRLEDIPTWALGNGFLQTEYEVPGARVGAVEATGA